MSLLLLNFIRYLQPTLPLYNGIDKTLYIQKSDWKRERFGLKNNETVILYAGRLDQGKGVIELMDAVTLLTSASFKNSDIIIP
ncbi:hypothetical protein [Xenorhabdus sp. Sc-CR9]|uniref:hypothetical protein n=1 Tax=Xenorhabdus sp. Sc-CR9 TaxID=2584468 RepID=UPI001F4823B2|nr:hypothetical protein [Xenorhabdus sp. Sc-CR9]